MNIFNALFNRDDVDTLNKLISKRDEEILNLQRRCAELQDANQKNYEFKDQVAFDFNTSNAISIEREWNTSLRQFQTVIGMPSCNSDKVIYSYLSISNERHAILLEEFVAEKARRLSLVPSKIAP